MPGSRTRRQSPVDRALPWGVVLSKARRFHGEKRKAGNGCARAGDDPTYLHMTVGRFLAIGAATTSGRSRLNAMLSGRSRLELRPWPS